MEFETVIGLEIHAQMKTNSKIFCSCTTEFGNPPNSNTCPICLGMPGVLPVLNKEVVDSAIALGLATNCTISKWNQFARKNYFYPDLPKGYQISQFDLPICEHGHINVTTGGKESRIGITRIHMEEDAGKLIHDDREPKSYVDLNRTGTPLLEIVSEPDIRSPEEAANYLRKLHAVVTYLDICNGNMQEGSFRCDANISLRPVGQKELGTRTELKNMNSFRNVQKALEYEVRRQRDMLLDGEDVLQQTLLWDPDKQKTNAMRGKEEAHDYRYFPDPDLVPVVIDDEWISRVQEGLPELPEAKLDRFISDLGLGGEEATILTSERALADYFEAALAQYGNGKKLGNWILTEVMRVLNSTDGMDISTFPVSPEDLGKLMAMIDKGTISGKIAKTVFDEMITSGKDAGTIVAEKNLVQNSDEGEILQMVQDILKANPEQVSDFKGGKTKLMGFFVGQLMKASKGKANPQMANKLFSQELGK